MSVIPLQRIEGKYEILEKIREGGMGAIYKVRHRLLDEIRVIKLMRQQLVEDEELRARFSREARVAIKLRHPNIARLDDFTVDEDGTAYIVMEYIRGRTLEELLKFAGPPPLGLALEIAQQSLRALGYLHAKGFVHRDISPDNLMVAEDADGHPQIKLIDLGIAKILGGADGELTHTGLFLGKVRYASPEQFGPEGAAAADARGDLYSFGIVLYELLTGVYPIPGRDPMSLIASHLLNPPLPFADTDPHERVPPGLRAVVLKALAKPPADRFASARDFARELAGFRIADDAPAEAWKRLIEAHVDGDATLVTPGSTQARLDARFGPVTTPPPTAAGPQPRTLLTRPAQPDEERRQVTAAEVSALLEEARRHAAEDDLDAALASARLAEAGAPGRMDARALVGQLAAAVERREQERRRDEEPVAAAGPAGPQGDRNELVDTGHLLATADVTAAAAAARRDEAPLQQPDTEWQRLAADRRRQDEDRQEPESELRRQHEDRQEQESALRQQDADRQERESELRRQDADRQEQESELRRQEDARRRQATLQEAVAAIDGHLQRGDHAKAAVLLAAAEAAHGPKAKPLWRARERMQAHESAAALLREARRGSEAGPARREAPKPPPPAAVPPIGDAALDAAARRRESATAEPSLPIGGRRLSDPLLDLPFRNAPATAAPAARAAATTADEAPPEPPARRPRQRLGVWAAAAVGVVVLLLAVAWAASRHRAGPPPAGDSAPVAGDATAAQAPPATAGGGLIIDALPWAEIVEVRDTRGQAQPIPSPAYTPLALLLPAGRYTVRLRHPSVHHVVEVSAEVPAGPGAAPARVVGELRPGDPDEFLKEMGW